MIQTLWGQMVTLPPQTEEGLIGIRMSILQDCADWIGERFDAAIPCIQEALEGEVLLGEPMLKSFIYDGSGYLTLNVQDPEGLARRAGLTAGDEVIAGITTTTVLPSASEAGGFFIGLKAILRAQAYGEDKCKRCSDHTLAA